MADPTYFFCRLIPPRGDFMQTMTRDERADAAIVAGVGFSYEISVMPRIVVA